MISDRTRPVRRSLISMVGVADPEARLDFNLDSLAVGLGPRRIRCAEDVVLVPDDGLVGPDGATLPDGQIRRGPNRILAEGLEQIEPVTPVSVLGGEALFLGRFNGHFGHFLVEAMARWWAVAHVPPDMPLLWLCQPGLHTGKARELLAGFGIDDQRIRLVTEPIRVRRLLLPDVSMEANGYFHEHAMLPFQELGDRIAGAPPVTDRPLYLSRARLPEHKLRYAHERGFEQFMREEGALVVHPQELPVWRQIQVLRESSVIIGVWGSAFHGLLFTRHQPHLYMLTAATLPGTYALQADVLGTPLTATNGFRPARQTPAGESLPPRYVFADVATQLHALGIVRNPGRAWELQEREMAESPLPA